MEYDLKSFNLRKRSNIKLDKHYRNKRYKDIKSHQKVNKVIRLHTHCALSSSLENGSIDEFILPSYTDKHSLTWWDCDQYKLKIYTAYY